MFPWAVCCILSNKHRQKTVKLLLGLLRHNCKQLIKLQPVTFIYKLIVNFYSHFSKKHRDLCVLLCCLFSVSEWGQPQNLNSRTTLGASLPGCHGPWSAPKRRQTEPTRVSTALHKRMERKLASLPSCSQRRLLRVALGTVQSLGENLSSWETCLVICFHWWLSSSPTFAVFLKSSHMVFLISRKSEAQFLPLTDFFLYFSLSKKHLKKKSPVLT